MPAAIPVPVAAASAASTTASAAALPSAATSAPLFGSIAALAINRTIATGLKWHRRGLSAAGADHGCARAHTRAGPRTCAVTALVLRVGRCVASAATGEALLSLAAWFAATGRGVAALLEELLFTCGEGKFLTAVATG